jgi:hypothetical protein
LFIFNSSDDKILKDFDISDDIKDALVDNIRRRLTPQPVKVRADIEVTCFQYEGIDAIKAALTKGQETSTSENAPIKVFTNFISILIFVVDQTSCTSALCYCNKCYSQRNSSKCSKCCNNSNPS